MNSYHVRECFPIAPSHTNLPDSYTHSPRGWLNDSDLFMGWDLFFPNHAMSRCHTFFISSFNIAYLCSKLGLGGQLVQIMVIHLRDVPQHLGTCAHRKARSSDGETGGLDKLSPVAGTPHPLSQWSEFPSHLSISKFTFFSKMIMEERCKHKRKRSSVPCQLTPPVITAPSDGKDKRVSRNVTPHHSSLIIITCVSVPAFLPSPKSPSFHCPDPVLVPFPLSPGSVLRAQSPSYHLWAR